MMSISIIFLLIGVLLDIVSCYLNTTKKINKGGASGIPGVSLAIYLLVFLWDKNLIIIAKYFDILFFVAVYIFLQHGLPALVSWVKQIRNS